MEAPNFYLKLLIDFNSLSELKTSSICALVLVGFRSMGKNEAYKRIMKYLQRNQMIHSWRQSQYPIRSAQNHSDRSWQVVISIEIVHSINSRTTHKKYFSAFLSLSVHIYWNHCNQLNTPKTIFFSSSCFSLFLYLIQPFYTHDI